MIEIRCRNSDSAHKNLATADKISVTAYARQIRRERRPANGLGNRSCNLGYFTVIKKSQYRFTARTAPQVIGLAKAARYGKHMPADHFGDTLP
jgi:hypothetical protein